MSLTFSTRGATVAVSGGLQLGRRSTKSRVRYANGASRPGRVPGHQWDRRSRDQDSDSKDESLTSDANPAIGATSGATTCGKVSLVGDVLLHSNLLRLGERNGDFRYIEQLKPTAHLIKDADCTSANLESISAGSSFGISGFPSFNAPVDLLDGLKTTGFDVLSIANNHMLDKGESALLTSIENIHARELLPTGAGATEAELEGAAVVNINGIRVGFVSFTDGAKIKTSSIYNSHINYFDGENSRSRMVRRVVQVKRRINAIRNACDLIVLQLHFGEEYHQTPSAFQKELIASFSELPVDVIVGHHPHVLQPVEWVENSKGKHVLVAYSLGNFFSGQAGLYRQIGGIFSFRVQRTITGGITSVSIAEPTLTLTYVDAGDNFLVKPLSDVIKARRSIRIAGGHQVDSQQIYSRLIQRLAGAGGAILIE